MSRANKDEGRRGSEKRTSVRFAYTLIQPWSLGLACKCVAIFRPVSRVYNTFGWSRRILCRWTRSRRCVCVHADTCTCVALQLQDPPNRLPTRPVDTNTTIRTPTPTPNGAQPRIVRTGNTIFRPSFSIFPLSRFLLRSIAERLLLRDPLGERQGYARSSNHAYCRGYTPIDPKVPDNGQLENLSRFPDPQALWAWSTDAGTVDGC